MTDRELVEGYWKKAEFRPEDKMMPQYGGRIISYGSGEFLTDSHLSESEAWAAAAAYTREHQEKVRRCKQALAWANTVARPDLVAEFSPAKESRAYVVVMLEAELEGRLKGVTR